MVAPRALLRFGFFGVCVGSWVDAALSTRRGGACQTGAARALAASLKRRAAKPHSMAAAQADAMAILMRRTEMRTSAPILRSLSLILPQVASAKDGFGQADAPPRAERHIGHRGEVKP